ncbi:MAG TPA: aldose epimerase family protein [Saprospiraceae bacterium]|nr:aldose epimerase family protein [Saprospiraceae bacterium]
MNSDHSRVFGHTSDGKEITEFILRNRRGTEMRIINYGCTITSLSVEDREGRFDNIVLGYDNLEEYMLSKEYAGSVIGRYANRIEKGKFSIGNKQYEVSINHNGHHLHGGNIGFDKIVWDASSVENENGLGIDFFYMSKDGEEGYPGNLNLGVRYFLSHENAVIFNYSAITDQKTIINLTQHSYFNLNGWKENILSHQLQINANYFLPVDRELIPTGEIKHVENSAFDFRERTEIGGNMNFDDSQLTLAKGFDHNFVLQKMGEELSLAATLYDPISGRTMEVHTSEPGIQLYTGNHLEGITKISGMKRPYSGLCLETQHFPDSPHHSNFPSVELHPDESFQSTTILLFSAK